MLNTEVSQIVLSHLAGERRRVCADWRLRILLQRQKTDQGELVTDRLVNQTLLRFLRAKTFQRIGGVEGVFAVTPPFAELLPLSAEEIVQEADPWCVLSHHSAMFRHGICDEPPNHLTVSEFAHDDSAPLGTTAEEWIGVRNAPRRRPREALKLRVVRRRMPDSRSFGVTVDVSQAAPIRLTDLERTLLDGLKAPELSGGQLLVLRAWRHATDRLNLSRLVGYLQRINSPVMIARVGFLCDEMKLAHPYLENFRGKLPRGSSMRLAPGSPFGSRYDTSWNLSINIDGATLAEIESDT